ncbi:MAG: hypothetical protein ND866_27365 [Pyrinomonadaceae bacterium]|nr:hypothetical protein [Pyrinomonadaceae bacterium]
MVIKRNRKRHGYDKEHGQHELIVGIYDRKGRHVGEQNYQLGRDYIHQDGTDKEPLLALEDHPTGRAVIRYFKGRLDDRRFSTDGAPEQKASAQEVRKRRVVPAHYLLNGYRPAVYRRAMPLARWS